MPEGKVYCSIAFNCQDKKTCKLAMTNREHQRFKAQNKSITYLSTRPKYYKPMFTGGFFS